MSKYLTNFKNYFHLDPKRQKFSLRKFLGRLNEKWAKDKKFRLKFGVIFLSIFGFGFILSTPGNNSLYQKNLKKVYISQKVKKSVKNFDKHKTNQSLQNYLDEIVNKIDYMIKNDLYDEKLIIEELATLNSLIENYSVMNYKLILEISHQFGILIGLMHDKFSLLFNEEAVIEAFANYIALFSENYSIKADADNFKLDPIFMEYLKNSLSSVINSIKILLIYCKDEKMKLRALKSFEKILIKKSKYYFYNPFFYTDSLLTDIIYDDNAKDFILTIFGSLVRNKNDSQYKSSCVKIYSHLLKENHLFINEYFRIHLISNLIIHILDPMKIEDKLIMKEILSVVAQNLNHLSEEGEILDELNRLKIILVNSDDEDVKKIFTPAKKISSEA